MTGDDFGTVEPLNPAIIYLDHPVKKMRVYWGGKDWVRELDSAQRFGSVKEAMEYSYTMAMYSGVLSDDDARKYQLSAMRAASVREEPDA